MMRRNWVTRGYPTIRELHGRATPRAPRVPGTETSGTSTTREAPLSATASTSPTWRTTPPDSPAIRERHRRHTSLVPRVGTAPESCTCTIRESTPRPPQAESGTP